MCKFTVLFAVYLHLYIVELALHNQMEDRGLIVAWRNVKVLGSLLVDQQEIGKSNRLQLCFVR